MKDKIQLNSKIIEISSKSHNTRKIKMLVHTLDEENHRGLTFPEIGTLKYHETLRLKPVVVKVNTTETDFKGHEPRFNEQGQIVQLDTVPVGVITNTYVEDYKINALETKKVLMAEADIWSYKFPTVVEIMENLFYGGNLDTSVEAGIIKYTDDSTVEHRTAEEWEYLANALLGSTILPADDLASVTEIFNKEIAEAAMKDILIQQNEDSKVGGVTMLSYEEIREQLCILLNPKDNEAGNWQMDFVMWDSFTFDNYIVVRSYNDGNYYKVNYQVENESAVALVGEPVKVAKIVEFKEIAQDEEIQIAEEELFNRMKELEQKTKELSSTIEEKEQELNSMKEEKTQLETKVEELGSTKETEVQELQTKIEELNKEIATKEDSLKMTETEANEKIIKLGESLEDLKTQLSSLVPIKDEYEKLQAEKQEKELNTKREELKQFALNSKMIKEEEFESNEEIKNMIQEVNSSAIKSIIADRIVEQANIEVNSQKEDVIISAKEQEDLLPQSTKEQMYAPARK